jgi:hypothetical protein
MADKDDEHQQTWRDFGDAVNMTASQLSKWLDDDRSTSVGQKSGGSSESTGHTSGRHIVTILNTKKSDLTDGDYSHMRKVIGYVKRHLAQRPSGDVSNSAWRYSLIDWGHDPTKKN